MPTDRADSVPDSADCTLRQPQPTTTLLPSERRRLRAAYAEELADAPTDGIGVVRFLNGLDPSATFAELEAQLAATGYQRGAMFTVAMAEAYAGLAKERVAGRAVRSQHETERLASFERLGGNADGSGVIHEAQVQRMLAELEVAGPAAAEGELTFGDFALLCDGHRALPRHHAMRFAPRAGSVDLETMSSSATSADERAATPPPPEVDRSSGGIRQRLRSCLEAHARQRRPVPLEICTAVTQRSGHPMRKAPSRPSSARGPSSGAVALRPTPPTSARARRPVSATTTVSVASTPRKPFRPTTPRAPSGLAAYPTPRVPIPKERPTQAPLATPRELARQLQHAAAYPGSTHVSAMDRWVQ